MSFKDFSSKQKDKPEDKADTKPADAPAGTAKSSDAAKGSKPAR
ncbi:hypothetical protein [Fodinicurvata sediminis]|nr:hypothetical protein [Fodinicurvata sediminis]